MPAQHPQSGPDAMVGAAPIWRFAEFELDAEQRQLRRSGEPVALEPKPFDFLCLLLEQAGSLVTKDQLIEDIWAGRVVTESVITRCAAKVRKALGETTAEQLVTVHGYGYRFEAEVQRVLPPQATEEVPDASSAPARASTARSVPASERTRRAWLWAAAAGVIVVLVAALLGWRATPEMAHYEHPSIAVLPFANLSPDTESTDYLAGGVHENLLTQLSRVEGLKVISRTSVARYAGTTESIPVIGQRLGVNYVLEGSVQVVDKRLRVNAQLIEVATDHHRWADALDGEVADVLEIQSRIATQVAKYVGVQLLPANSTPAGTASVKSLAYEAYLRARDQFRRDALGRESLFRAQAFLDRAISEDPQFAPAHALRSRVHTMTYWFGYDASPLRLQQARSDWQRALELDENLAEAYVAQGQYRSAGFRDYPGALESYDRALALQAGSAEVHQFRATTFRRLGQIPRYLSEVQLTLELDPENTVVLKDVAGVYRLLGDYPQARLSYRRVLDLDPDDLMAQVQLAMLDFEQHGDLGAFKDFLQQREGDSGPGHFFDYFRFHVAYLERDYARALELLSSYLRVIAPSAASGPRRSTLIARQAELLDRLGRDQEAASYWRRADAEVESLIAATPNDPAVVAHAAMVKAGLNDVAGANAMGARALALAELDADPMVYWDVVSQVVSAWIYADLHDQALTLLQRLQDHIYPVSPGVLNHHPQYDPVRSAPAFRSLMVS